MYDGLRRLHIYKHDASGCPPGVELPTSHINPTFNPKHQQGASIYISSELGSNAEVNLKIIIYDMSRDEDRNARGLREKSDGVAVEREGGEREKWEMNFTAIHVERRRRVIHISLSFVALLTLPTPSSLS